MTRQADSSSKTRPPLSRERVLDAAIRLADQNGIEALSMRRLAKELGVEAMSLYNHVANKDEILDGIIEAVASEVDVPSEEAEWKPATRQVVISIHKVLLRHAWAHGIWMNRMPGPARFGYTESLLRNLDKAGFAKDLTYHAFHILESYIHGFTSQHLNFPYKGEELKGLATNFLQHFPADEYPHLAEHVREHLAPSHGEKGGFELGLDLILDGLERARDTT